MAIWDFICCGKRDKGVSCLQSSNSTLADKDRTTIEIRNQLLYSTRTKIGTLYYLPNLPEGIMER